MGLIMLITAIVRRFRAIRQRRQAKRRARRRRRLVGQHLRTPCPAGREPRGARRYPGCVLAPGVRRGDGTKR